MSVSNGYISAPVASFDPYVATGAPAFGGEYPVALNAWIHLAAYANKWAKCKPMATTAAHLDSQGTLLSEYTKQAAFYGMTVPGNGYITAADINSDWEWNKAGWTYALDTNSLQWTNLLEWEGYDNLATAPCSATIAHSDRFYTAEIVADMTLYVAGDSGTSLRVSDFGVGVATLGNMYPCILVRATNTDDWAIITGSQTLNQLKGGSVRVALSSTDINAVLRAGSVKPTQFQWWACACSQRFDTLTKKTTIQLSDAGCPSFCSLPLDNPTDCLGNAQYTYIDYAAKYMRVTIWGINNCDYWDVTAGMLPFASYTSSPLQFGQMLGDHMYGLQIGFTIENTAAPGQFTETYTAGSGSGALYVSTNFAGSSAGWATGMSPSVTVRGELWMVTSPRVDGGALTLADNGSGQLIEIGPGQSKHFVVSAQNIMCAPLEMTSVPTGQSLNVPVTAGIQHRTGSASFSASN